MVTLERAIELLHDSMTDNKITQTDIDVVYQLVTGKKQVELLTMPSRTNLKNAFVREELYTMQQVMYGKVKAQDELYKKHEVPFYAYEFFSGIELFPSSGLLGLTEIETGLDLTSFRVVDRKKTIVGQIHSHHNDSSHSPEDARRLYETNDMLSMLMTPAGRMFLLIKNPTAPTLEGRSGYKRSFKISNGSLQGTHDDERILLASLKDICKLVDMSYYSGDIASLQFEKMF